MRLGIVMFDEKYAVEAGSEELAGCEVYFPWVMMRDRHFWPVPIRTAIARGATNEALLAGDPDAANAVVDAAQRLDGGVDLILGNCGFMWPATRRAAGRIETPMLTSGLAFLDLALTTTSQPVGLITYSEASLLPLIEEHEQRDRLRVLGLDDMPDWAALRRPNWWEAGGWSFDSLRRHLLDRLTKALADGGDLDGVRILVLECTWLPTFRSDIRAATGLPVLDIVSFAATALS